MPKSKVFPGFTRPPSVAGKHGVPQISLFEELYFGTVKFAVRLTVVGTGVVALVHRADGV